MSKQFSKNRNSQQKNNAVETWSPSQSYQPNFFAKMSKPPRRTTQHFMTTQYEQQQSKQVCQQNDLIKKPLFHHHSGTQNQQPQQLQQQDSSSLIYNPIIKSNNATLKIRNSQSKKCLFKDSSAEIQQRFKQIENIMGFENENLRKQKDYLLRTILKMQIKQRQMKNQLASYQQRVFQLQQQNQILRHRYQKARNFISSGIGKMQQVISKQPVQNNSNNFNSNTNTAHHSNQSSVNLSQQIQQLNDKFDALMYEYQKTRQPEIRKKCMEIAKQLRKLRKMQQDSKQKDILQNKI